jgi:hypothetical protein
MKTPRQILLERHRDTTARLDVIRQATIRTLSGGCELEKEMPPHPGSLLLGGGEGGVSRGWVRGGAFASALLVWSKNIWHGLILPCHRVWAGLAVAWVFILIANVSLHGDSHIVMAKATPTPEMITAWRQQERQLAELIGPVEIKAARPLKPFSPRPSSERRLETLVA